MSKKAPKFEALVVNAIRRLQAAQGSTASEIAGYLSQEYDVAGPEVRRQIQLTIRRGVNYGILQKLKRGGYITCDRNVPEPLDRSSMSECYSRRSSRRHSRRPKRSGRSRHRRAKSRSHRGRSSRKRAAGRKRAASRRGRKMTTGSRRAAARTPRKRRAAATNEEQKATSQSGQETPTSERPVSSPPSRGRSNTKSPTRNP